MSRVFALELFTDIVYTYLTTDKTYDRIFAHYRQTYKAKQFLLRVLFIIGFVLFTRFYFQSLLP